MLLVLDAGNSFLKAALSANGVLVAAGRVATDRDAAQEVTRRRLSQLIAELRGAVVASHDAEPTIEGIALASVVPAWSEAVHGLAAERGVPLLEASAATIPMRVDVEHPETVGRDRLVNAFAGARSHGAPLIVVALGTATTVDVVDAEGTYRGGAIAPGIGLGLAALASHTAQLPNVEPAFPGHAIARTTVDAMRSGAVLGHVGVVRELRRLMTAEIGAASVRTILTGGLASDEFARELGDVDAIDRELTLRGLVQLWEARTPAAAGSSAG